MIIMMLAQNQWPLLWHSPAHRHWRFLSACPMAVLGTHLARMVRAIFAQLGASSRSDLQFHSSYDRGWGARCQRKLLKGCCCIVRRWTGSWRWQPPGMQEASCNPKAVAFALGLQEASCIPGGCHLHDPVHRLTIQQQPFNSFLWHLAPPSPIIE